MTSLTCAAFVWTTSKLIGVGMIAVCFIAFAIIAMIKPKTDDEAEQVVVKDEPVVQAQVTADQPVVEEETIETVEETPVVAEEEVVVSQEVAEETQVAAEVALAEEVKTEVVAEPVVEEVVATVAEEPSNDPFSKFKGIPVGKKLTFAEKIVAADEENQAIYNLLKNELMSYKKVSNRLTKVIDIFKYKGTYLAKVGLVGKTIKLHLALDPNEYAVTKYHHQDLGEKKKYEFVPLALKVKSPRSQKYALELIEGVMQQAGLEKNPKYQEVDYVASMVEAAIPIEEVAE